MESDIRDWNFSKPIFSSERLRSAQPKFLAVSNTKGCDHLKFSGSSDPKQASAKADSIDLIPSFFK